MNIVYAVYSGWTDAEVWQWRGYLTWRRSEKLGQVHYWYDGKYFVDFDIWFFLKALFCEKCKESGHFW